MNNLALLKSSNSSSNKNNPEGWKLCMSESTECWNPGSRTWPSEDVIGYLSYDFKNKFEDLHSQYPDLTGFPEYYFFKSEKTISFHEPDMETIFEKYGLFSSKKTSPVALSTRCSKKEYLTKVQKIKEHIERGDVYELNFCIKFEATDVEIDPARTFLSLYEKSNAPFAAFLKTGPCYFIGASPERFLKKTKTQLLSEPMKGTSARGKTATEDEFQKTQLGQDEKERAENIMIADLVRNDLSRIAKKGTVQVNELCRVHTFKTAHQMVSSVACELKLNTDFIDILKATFPMGSMTGAPKISAMRLIERYEETRRGLYSGAFGTVSKSGDFDLSVVIRSILYNENKKYLSFMVGSAITAASDPEKEYEECLLKAKALIEVVGGDFTKFA